MEDKPFMEKLMDKFTLDAFNNLKKRIEVLEEFKKLPKSNKED